MANAYDSRDKPSRKLTTVNLTPGQGNIAIGLSLFPSAFVAQHIALGCFGAAVPRDPLDVAVELLELRSDVDITRGGDREYLHATVRPRYTYRTVQYWFVRSALSRTKPETVQAIIDLENCATRDIVDLRCLHGCLKPDAELYVTMASWARSWESIVPAGVLQPTALMTATGDMIYRLQGLKDALNGTSTKQLSLA